MIALAVTIMFLCLALVVEVVMFPFRLIGFFRRRVRRAKRREMRRVVRQQK